MSIAVERRVLFKQMEHTQREDEASFLNAKGLPTHHQEVENDRLPFLEAFQAAVTPVLEEYLGGKNLGPVLEVGCGTGFFSRWLAPEWLKRRLVGFDINLPSLQTMSCANPERVPFQASIYRLPIRSDSLEAIIGYSSFDSPLFLDEALTEAWRVLRKGGRIVLFQDLVTELYQPLMGFPPEEMGKTVEEYHLILVNKIEKAGFTILAGREDCLEGRTVESIEKIRQRVPDLELDNWPFPVVATWDRGHQVPVMRTSIRESLGLTREEVNQPVETHGRMLQQNFSDYLKKIGAGSGDLIELVRMRYLVAQK